MKCTQFPVQEVFCVILGREGFSPEQKTKPKKF